MNRRTCERRSAFLKEPKSKNYQDGKDKEDDRANPIPSVRDVCAHGTIPLNEFVNFT